MRFCMRNKEWDGDVFLGSKMIKFQSIEVWERWIVCNDVVWGVWYNGVI